MKRRSFISTHPLWRWLLVALVFLLLGFCLWWFVNFLFSVRTVVVSGATEGIADTTFLKQQRNLLFLNLNSFKQQFTLEYSGVTDVVVRKQLPGTLVISFNVRMPLAQVTSGGSVVYIDELGVVPYPTKIALVPQLSCPGGEFSKSELDPRVAFALRIVRRLTQDFGETVESIACVGRDDVTINLPDMELFFSQNYALSRVLSSLQFLFKQFRIEGNRPGSVDLRYEKPVLLPKGFVAPQVASESGHE